MTNAEVRRDREDAAQEAGTLISHQGGIVELGLDEWHDLRDTLDSLTAERRELRDILREMVNALNLTYGTVPSDGSRPHWCSHPAPRHDGICTGMLQTQDRARAALSEGGSK